MIICPVCEHSQAQGEECDNCGMKLQAPRAIAVAVAPLQELEQTGHSGGRAPVVAQPIPELDQTAQKAGPDLPPQVVPELEATRQGAVGQVAVDAVPELDTGRALDDGVRTAAPTGAVVCRYCRNVQAEGLVCERCGMRLPRPRFVPPEAASKAAPKAASDEDANWTPCPKCRTPNRPNRLCTVCGTRVAAAEA